jgi:hypothetical protein
MSYDFSYSYLPKNLFSLLLIERNLCYQFILEGRIPSILNKMLSQL